MYTRPPPPPPNTDRGVSTRYCDGTTSDISEGTEALFAAAGWEAAELLHEYLHALWPDTQCGAVKDVNPLHGLLTTPEYGNISWALIQLHRFLVAYAKKYKRGDDTDSEEEPSRYKSVAADVQRWIDEIVVGCEDEALHRYITWQQDDARVEFFSVYGNLMHLVGCSQPPATTMRIIAFSMIEGKKKRENVAILPVEESRGYAGGGELSYAGVHKYGLNWSRAWALKSLHSAILRSQQSIRGREGQEEVWDEKQKGMLLECWKAHLNAGLDTFKRIQLVEDKEWYGSLSPIHALVPLPSFLILLLA